MRTKRNIVIIAHNLRSTHNVGAILRTAEGLGINKVYLTGYTPYPLSKNDSRLPHLAAKITKDIHKTALGAESSQAWSFKDNVIGVINKLKQAGYSVAALEQTSQSKNLATYQAPARIAIVVGREVEGIEKDILKLCDLCVEIPMKGNKESFNVTQALAMALYQFSYF